MFRSLPPRPLHCGALFTKEDKAASFLRRSKQLNNLMLCTKHMTTLKKYLVSSLPQVPQVWPQTFTTISLKSKRKTTNKSRQRADRWHQGWPQLSASKVITTTWRSYSTLYAVSEYTCWEDNLQFCRQEQILSIIVGGHSKRDIRKTGENKPLEQLLHV